MTATSEMTMRRLRALLRFVVSMTSHLVRSRHLASTMLQGFIFLNHVVWLLLRTLFPALPRQWIASPSFNTTFSVLDIDANFTPEQLLRNSCPDIHGAEHSRPQACLDLARNARLVYLIAHSRLQIDQALYQLGIAPSSPTWCLIQWSCLGRRHAFVFGQPRYPNHYMQMYLFRDVRLPIAEGEVAFLPIAGLRLPFGHLAGLSHDPLGWIRLIDAYQTHRKKRHSLGRRCENLSTSRRRVVSAPSFAQFLPASSALPPSTASPLGGIPRRLEISEIQQFATQQTTERFLRFLRLFPLTTDGAEALLPPPRHNYADPKNAWHPI